MKTRNSPKPAAKKTPPVKKTPTKPPATEPAASTPTPEVPKPASTPTTTPKTASTPASKQPKTGAAATTPKPSPTPTPTPTPKVVSTTPKAEDASASKATTAETKVTPGAKSVVKKKVMKKVLKKVAKPSTAKKSPLKEESVVVDESLKKEEVVGGSVDESTKKEEEKETVVATEEKSPKKEQISNPSVVEVESNVESEPVVEKVEELVVEKVDDGEGGNDDKDPEGEPDKMEEDVKEDAEGGDVQLGKEEEQNVDEVLVDYGEQEGFQEPGDDECAEDNAEEEDDEGAGEDEAKGSDEEHREISALAKERKSKKEQEIFVGGLDRDTVEEDIKKAFKDIGEVVEVRLHKNPTTNKNKGYAFVKFASKEQASKALSELKNPLIRGKRCGVAPSEDNDTLFVGNICNTWTKEAIKTKLTEYGLGGVESITLVADAQHEGLSRGFAFVEFSCHADAMLAYKRLQKPDAIFGHAERSVKVAFAEPLREPDPEIMAQVKSVFIDGLPQHWDEERVREHFKPYGEIERIVLARNMPSAKRKDFGFVDFSTHEAAIACIDGVNNTELGDEKSKSRVKVRLSNPLPKTQAVKGGLCGGFRIGRPTGFSRFGRGIAQAGRSSNRVNFQRGKDSHPRGRGRTGRYGFANEDILESPYSSLRGRRPFGGRGGFAGRRGYDEDFPSRAATSSRPEPGRPRYAAIERGGGRSTLPRRQPISPEERFSRPIGGRHYVDDPYLYENGGYGLKRPYSMLDHEPGYLEPNRLRPRYEHPDPVGPSRETRYQGGGSGLYSSDYYASHYGGGSYSPMYGGDRSYGGGYYY